MTLTVIALVFLADVVGDLMVGRYHDARIARDPETAARWSAAIALLVGVNILGFVSVGWWAIPASVAGSYVGTKLSFRR